MNETELCYLPAQEIARRIQAKQLSCVEVMDTFLARIERLNPEINAIVTLLPEQARARAAEADAALAKGEVWGPFHGLPCALKDDTETAGVRTTFGSPIFAENIPEQDDIVAERYKRAGAILLGKTNLPEFGAGSHTFNAVFGLTRNPYDLGKSAGGSSGGSAAALAAGLVPLANGGDFGGSLRNPGNFNNIVGLRPSPGRVPRQTKMGWASLSVAVPLARTVEDERFMLSVLAGPDARSPISIQQPGSHFARPLGRDFTGVKVAWSKDLGLFQVDEAVTQVLEAARPALEQVGCVVEEAHPDFRGAHEAYQAMRAFYFTSRHAENLKKHRHLFKETIIRNTEQGLKLTGRELSRAEETRTAIYHRVRVFLEQYEFLILPVNQLPPFDASMEYPTHINGVEMQSYIDWMATAYVITLTGLPAVSLPAGFTADGLPVGMQIVARHECEFELLQFAHALEQALPHHQRHPAMAQ